MTVKDNSVFYRLRSLLASFVAAFRTINQLCF